MILCKNGHPNPDGATYCEVCKVYIDATAQPVEPEPVAPPPPPPPPEPEVTAPNVSLAPALLPVLPGGEGACEIRLHNPGGTAQDYVVELAGGAAAWGKVDPWLVSLAAGTGGVTRVTFQPPASATAGMVPFEVKVTPERRPAAAVVANGTLEVAAPPPTPVQALSAQLSPQASHGRSAAEHVLTIMNPGSAPTGTVVSASDPSGFLAFDIEPPQITVAPATTVSANVRLRARKRIYFRDDVPRPFRVLVVPEGGSSVSVEGTFVQQRFIPVVLMPVAGFFLVILVIAALLILLVIIIIIAAAT